MKHRLVIAALALFLAGCGRGYRLVGRVVLLVGSGAARAGIHEVTGRPMPAYGVAVPDAVVTLFHELSSDGRPVRDSVWNESVKTGANGTCELFSYAAPGRKNLCGLEVTASGFRRAYATYWDHSDPDEQAFFVILEPGS